MCRCVIGGGAVEEGPPRGWPLLFVRRALTYRALFDRGAVHVESSAPRPVIACTRGSAA